MAPEETEERTQPEPPSHDPALPRYEEGKRAGAHPLLVLIGVIVGLWILMVLYIPSSKNKPPTVHERAPESVPVAEDPDAAPVMFRIGATMPDVNAISVIVPPEATESQLVALLKRFRQARLDNTLSQLLPATTPGHKLGDHAIAEIYIVSDPKFASAEAIRVLARGAHAPGELYPQAIPFEVAMEHIRGFYRIDLHDTSKPDQASLGFADESGVHSRQYRRVF